MISSSLAVESSLVMTTSVLSLECPWILISMRLPSSMATSSKLLTALSSSNRWKERALGSLALCSAGTLSFPRGLIRLCPGPSFYLHAFSFSLDKLLVRVGRPATRTTKMFLNLVA